MPYFIDGLNRISSLQVDYRTVVVTTCYLPKFVSNILFRFMSKENIQICLMYLVEEIIIEKDLTIVKLSVCFVKSSKRNTFCLFLRKIKDSQK